MNKYICCDLMSRVLSVALLLISCFKVQSSLLFRSMKLLNLLTSSYYPPLKERTSLSMQTFSLRTQTNTHIQKFLSSSTHSAFFLDSLIEVKLQPWCCHLCSEGGDMAVQRMSKEWGAATLVSLITRKIWEGIESIQGWVVMDELKGVTIS